MKKCIMLLFAVLTMGLSLLGCQSATSMKVAPDAALVGLNTEDTTIYRLAGKRPLYINFWATWCPHCVSEMPVIEEMYKKYGNRVQFAAISVDDSMPDAQKMIAERGMTVPVYTGDVNKIGLDYSLDAIPRSILIGTDGKIIAEHLGGMSEAELEAFLAKALK